jgi:hypothetical protein
MSMPNVPNITPNIDIKVEKVINLLLVSIALEELGISHIINAEGEKIQEVIAKHGCIDDLLKIDKSVQTTLRDLIKKEMLLEFKFENILELIEKEHCKH